MQTNPSLICRHSPKTDKLGNAYIMNVWNHELHQGSEVRCSGTSEHFLPYMWHPSRFSENNWTPIICHNYQTNPSTNATQKCQLFQQSLHGDDAISLAFPWRISLTQFRIVIINQLQLITICFWYTDYYINLFLNPPNDVLWTCGTKIWPISSPTWTYIFLLRVLLIVFSHFLTIWYLSRSAFFVSPWCWPRS